METAALTGVVATLPLVVALTDGRWSAAGVDGAWLVTAACTDCDEAVDVMELMLVTVPGAPALMETVRLVELAPLTVAGEA